MSDLLKNIKTLLDEAIVSEKNTMNTYVKLTKAYEGLQNEKAKDVAGLHVQNFFPAMQDIKDRITEMETERFHIVSKIAKNAISRWKEAIKKIPQKDESDDESDLKGIDTWHVSNCEMVPNFTDIHNPLFREEAARLIDAGFDLAFNTDHGVGRIIVADNGFVIELSRYMKTTQIEKTTLDEVLDWIVYFYNQ